MSKKLQIEIPKPCHEDWDKMTISEQGRFCNSCTKIVVDFTAMNDKEILAYFRKKANEPICGQFKNDQLGRDIVVPRKRIPWLKYFFQFTLPLFLASLKTTAQAQEKRDKMAIHVVDGSIKCETIGRTITGSVSDEEGNGIPYASVMIKNTSIGVACDSSGKFTLKFAKTGSEEMLIISSVGYQSLEKLVNVDENPVVNISLSQNILTEVTVHGGTTTKGRLIVGGAYSVVKSVKEYPEPVTIPAEVTKVYPNPVKKTSFVNIEINSKEPDEIHLNLYSVDGRLIMEKKETILGGNHYVHFYLKAAIASGTYALVIRDREGKVLRKDKLIIQ